MPKEPSFVKDVQLTFTEPLEPLEEIKYIVIHHTQGTGRDIYKIHQFHRDVRQWSGIGYNYFIEENGDMIKGRGYHVGAHAKHYNYSSLGICLTGNFDMEMPTKEQLKAAVKLCMFLMKEFNVPVSCVLGHRELEGVSKTCPGLNFNMDIFRDQIRKQYKNG